MVAVKAGQTTGEIDFTLSGFCEGDSEPDGDLDGKDLAVFVDRFAAGLVDEDDLLVFAADYGRTDCP